MINDQAASRHAAQVAGIPWGSFGPNGEWEHNSYLAMSESEQYVENARNGFLPAMARAGEYGKTQPQVPRLQQLDLRIADCHTRRKAAIMRAAAATREV